MSDDLRNAPLFFEAEQRTDDWRKARLGIPTASNFKRILTAKGRPPPEASKDYCNQLIAERIFGVSFERDVGGVKAVQWGREHEDAARAAFEKKTGATVTPAKFVLERGGRFGASPDGYVFDAEPLEIKCPMVPQQIENLLYPPNEYWPQIMGQMVVTGADRAHFWSWSPFTPPVYVVLQRNKEFCDRLEAELDKFCDRLDEGEANALAYGQFDVARFQAERRNGRA